MTHSRPKRPAPFPRATRRVPSSRRTGPSRLFPNQHRHAYYTNDAAGQLLALAHVRTNDSSTLVQVDYGYNELGNRTNRSESFTGYTTASDSYTYDSTDQLTGVSYSGGARTTGFAYDAMGNLTNRLDTGSGTNTHTANNLNQLSTINSSAINYDLSGNLTNRPGWLYSWNANNQLMVAEPGSPTNGAVKITFAYDGRSRCVRRESWAWSTNTLNYQLSSSQLLYYSGWNLVEERDGGTNVVSYVSGSGVDEVIAKFTSTNTVFYHGDAQHSTLALTDASANVLERYRYEAFGLPTIFDSAFNVQPSSAYGNRMLFQGREWLAEVRLNDHRFRYYTPELQRWLSRDQLLELGGFNLYCFVDNEPINWFDALGLYTVYPDDYVGPLPKDGVRESYDKMRREMEGDGICSADDDLSLMVGIPQGTCVNLFSKGRNVFPTRGLLNHNNFVRIGWGWRGTKDAGRDVFRIAWGDKEHFDLWPLF